MSRARTQLTGAGPGARPGADRPSTEPPGSVEPPGGKVTGGGLGNATADGYAVDSGPAPGGLWERPACAYLVATQGADVIDVGLTVGELVDRLTADWEQLVGDLVLWEVGSKLCPAPRARVILYGTPGGIRTLWL